MTRPGTDPLRVLFCLATTALSGGVKVVFEVASGLARRGHSVEIFSYAESPRWIDLSVPLLETHDISDIDPSRYDFVAVTNAFLVPLLLPIARERTLFYAQDYESFHHSPDGTFPGFMADSETFRAIYELPVPIITESSSVQRLISERTGRRAVYAPVGIRKDLFCPKPRSAPASPRRVLFVGNYLMPYKGMRDGFEALRLLSQDDDVELVLATQEDRNRVIFEELPYPKEIHYRPPERAMADIYCSADVYCCSSWYEGLGLPALEAFCCGIRVVSTRTTGVDEYGVDGFNLLLADIHDPPDLARKLAMILDDADLANRLVAGGYETVRHRYEWESGIDVFEDALVSLAADRKELQIDEAYLDGLLGQLEADGDLTPIGVFRRFQELSQQIESACAGLDTTDDSETSERFRKLREDLGPFLVNTRAEYYRVFRSQFDLCQLVVALEGRPDRAEIVSRVLAARNGHVPHTQPALTEIRYLE